jgi:heterodisulfide reductase subunit A
MKRVAIIGGGVAGLSAALSLERRGIPSMIIERSDELGGLCGKLGCKGVDKCVRCDVCLARSLSIQVRSSPVIERMKNTDVRSISGHPGDFRLALSQAGQGHNASIRAGAIICAIGGEPFDARFDKRLGYGEIQNVITSLDMERQLADTGKVSIPYSGLPPKKVALLLCVGSRDERFNSGYCSKACCKYSFKLAQALRSIDPSCSITFFFMDWRLYDPRENVRTWSHGEDGVRLVRSRPSEILPGEGSRPEVRFAVEGDAGIESEAFDMVVLSVGIVCAKGSKELAEKLDVETDEHGFMRSVDSCGTSRRGIFLAGACSGPKEMVECVKQGTAAASSAAQFLEDIQ